MKKREENYCNHWSNHNWSGLRRRGDNFVVTRNIRRRRRTHRDWKWTSFDIGKSKSWQYSHKSFRKRRRLRSDWRYFCERGAKTSVWLPWIVKMRIIAYSVSTTHYLLQRASKVGMTVVVVLLTAVDTLVTFYRYFKLR